MPQSTPTALHIVHTFSSIVIVFLTITTLTSPLTLAAAAPSSSSPITTSLPSTTSNEHNKQPLKNMDAAPKYIVFSDVDGTLVHYPRHLQPHSDNYNNRDTNPSSSEDKSLIFLPPSKTGTRGVLSKRTLELCHQIRHGRIPSTTSTTNKDETDNPSLESHPKQQQRQQQQNQTRTPFVLVSGMRTSTLFQRLPYLPRADAYVSESGGRIFYPRSLSSCQPTSKDTGAVPHLVVPPVVPSVETPSLKDRDDNDDNAPFTLVEDMEWRRRMSNLDAAGPHGFHDAPPETPLDQRKGALWEYARHLIKRGYILDTDGYSTAFRVNRKMQPNHLMEGFDEFMRKCARRQDMPQTLGCSTNLGCVDVYPSMSGKKNCCAYLARRFLGEPIVHDNKDDDDDEITQSSYWLLKNNAFCLCDDDNDIEMALACRTAFLPSVTSQSIRERVEMQSDDDDEMQRHGRLVVTEDVDRGVVETRATERALEMILKEIDQSRND